MNDVEPAILFQINNLLCRFFLSFDQRDWTTMEACLAPRVSIDYASSGREPPSTMSGADFVARRRSAVDQLTKQHGFSNLLVTRTSNARVLSARCHYLILRFDLSHEHSEAQDNFFHSCGSYRFELHELEGGWKIAAITQDLLQGWGNRALHGGSSVRQP